MNLPVKDPVTIIPPNGIDPGPAQSTPPSDTKTLDDQREATLDVTRSNSVAPGATIKLVISAKATTVDGTVVAAEYVVDTNPTPAQVMSLSFGDCEQNGGAGVVSFYDNIFAQAVAEGISVLVSSGDSGAAGCDKAFEAPPASQSASINQHLLVVLRDVRRRHAVCRHGESKRVLDHDQFHEPRIRNQLPSRRCVE